MEVAADLAPFQEQVSAALVKSTRTVSQILAEDVNFHRSFDSNVSQSLDLQSSRLLDLTSSILRFATSNSDLNPPVLKNEENVDENWKSVVDVIDELLEKADASLDEFTGIIKKLSPSQQERDAALGKKSSSAQFPSVYDFGSSKIPKPQLSFDTPPDNKDPSSFRPLLQSKPHATVPLSTSLGEGSADDSTKSYNHPYAVEIANSEYPPSVYSSSPPQPFQPFETTTAKFVDTIEDVKSMLAELKNAKEIAIDLEHHDSHSYFGLVCLMQISTREKDWIVDTLKPWRQELQILNEVFADPNIVKVLHGSAMDVIWLQRDLGLYLVGLFDTYHASVALQYPKKSLKFLLDKFANFQADKKYQMADWRLRPLLPAMFDYARSDTHYLLYIFDQIRNELIEQSTPENNLIDQVLQRSKDEALQRYERPFYDTIKGHGSGGWYDLLSSSSATFTKEQLAVFRAIHEWRDETARADDEGVQSVLTKRALFRISQSMPVDAASLLKLASPVSPALRKRASQLAKIILDAKIAGATGPELQDIIKRRPLIPQEAKLELGTATAGGDKVILNAKDQGRAEVARAPISQFWGTILQGPKELDITPCTASATEDALRLSLPLPSGPLKLSDEPRKPSTDNQPPAPSVPSTTAEPPKPSNEIFTVKQFGAPKKRKSNIIDDEPALTDPADLDEISLSKVGKQPKPTSAKKQKTSRTTDGALESEAPNLPTPSKKTYNAVPFDYSNAESVLRANPAERKGPPKKAQFDPYQKALNAPIGLRRLKKETSGKSYTFRK